MLQVTGPTWLAAAAHPAVTRARGLQPPGLRSLLQPPLVTSSPPATCCCTPPLLLVSRPRVSVSRLGGHHCWWLAVSGSWCLRCVCCCVSCSTDNTAPASWSPAQRPEAGTATTASFLLLSHTPPRQESTPVKSICSVIYAFIYLINICPIILTTDRVKCR